MIIGASRPGPKTRIDKELSFRPYKTGLVTVNGVHIIIDEADLFFQGGLLYIGAAPQRYNLFLQNSGKIKILILQGGGRSSCHLSSFGHA